MPSSSPCRVPVPAFPDQALSGLTQRQQQCLLWVRHGKSSTDIGTILGISAQTVDEHIAAACRKLGVRTRVQGVIQAVLLGLVDE